MVESSVFLLAGSLAEHLAGNLAESRDAQTASESAAWRESMMECQTAESLVAVMVAVSALSSAGSTAAATDTKTAASKDEWKVASLAG